MTSSGGSAIRDFAYQTLSTAQVITAAEKYALGWYQDSWCWQRLTLVVTVQAALDKDAII